MSRSETLRLKQIKANLERRALVLDSIRAFFKKEGFLEVETPLLVPQAAPEQFIAPFTVNGWFLSTSPEMHMKRLLAAGYGNVFQITHCFRKGERGQLHNPEFTMLEWYRVDAGYLQIIDDTERLVLAVAGDLGLGASIRYQGQDIGLSRPWPRTTVSKAFRWAADWDPVLRLDPERFDLDLVDKVMPGFAPNKPTVMMDYPAANASMARLKPGDRKVAERAEVFVGGLELANAYTELTDAAELEKRFWQVIEETGDGEGHRPMPRRFLKAMADMPACGGIALGVDRLVMLLCDAAAIDEVVAFPRELA
jgi:elongation factor P--(R)-beta-lysine ligase